MSRLLPAFALVLRLSLAASHPLTEPFRLFDDFENDSLSQWASYPPAQDVGYEPSLSPERDQLTQNRFLTRTARPVSSGRLRLGFIKRLRLAASQPVRLSFAYRLNLQPTVAVIEIGVACADGQIFRRQMNATSGRDWSNVNVSFPEIPSGATLEAAFLVETVAKPDRGTDYRFSIDTVSLNAARDVAFSLLTPQAASISPFPELIAVSSYSPGDRVAVEVSAPVSLSRVICTLRDGADRTVATAPLRHTGETWANSDIYAIRASDASGVWRAQLTGTNASGLMVSTTLRFVVWRAHKVAHPSLFFGVEDRSTVVQRSRLGQFQAAWENLRAIAANAQHGMDLASAPSMFRLLDPRYLLPSLPLYFDFVSRVERSLPYNALSAFVSRDKDALQSVKTELLKLSTWPAWAPPWFPAHGQHTYYPVGELTAAAAFSYDLLYDDLSPEERTTMRRAILEFGIRNAYLEYVVDNRIMADTSNWIGHVVGGAILACLAVREEQDDPQLNTYLGGLLVKFENHLAASYLSDGSYGEGVSYQEFDLKTSALALNALQRAGIDYWRTTHVKESLAYPAYIAAHPLKDSMDFGDTHAPTGYSSAPVVKQSSDPAAQWLYSKFTHTSLADFLVAPNAEPAPPPPASLSRLFADKGNAVFRTGWRPEDAVLLFHAGPTFNHNHADQGQFLLRAFGKNLVVEAGYSDYYKDPYYTSYFSQAEGHNTVLVDGDPASQEIADTHQFKALDSYPRITDFLTSADYDSVGSELASVYRGRLTSYSRRVLFLKPHYLLIYDVLDGGAEAHRFEWLLHLPDKDRVTTSSDGAGYADSHAGLQIRVVAPSSPSIRLREGHAPFSTVNDAHPKSLPAVPAILDIQPAGKSMRQRFVVVLSIGRSGESARQLMSDVTPMNESNCTGLQLAGREVFFSNHYQQTSTCRGWTTDAASWTGSAKGVSGHLLTRLQYGGALLWKSNVPASFIEERLPDRTVLTVFTAKPGTIQFSPGFSPASDRRISYDATTRMIQFAVKPGPQTVALIR